MTTLIRTVLLTGGLMLATNGGVAVAQSAATGASGSAAAGGPLMTLQMPVLPKPVPVVLKPATTAVFVSDMIDPTSKIQPKCMGTNLPACQSAPKFDPRSASNFDPLWRRVLAVALAPSELVGVAETARARVGA